VAVTYSMNRLQGFECAEEICVTLNREDAIDPRRVLGAWCYEHPVFDAAALRAQRERPLVCGTGRTHFAGAYWGYGFHEDGVRSALEVTRRFGPGRGRADREPVR
jgi:predicted NAD/FAD-binding protein